jgi:AsmA-like C-terminal region
MTSEESSAPAVQPARSRFDRRARMVLIVAATGLLALAGAGLFLAWRWPFAQERVSQDLQGSFPATVTFTKFHSTYFPHPGCVAEGVVFRRLGRSADLPPVATIQKLTMVAHYSDMLWRPGYLAQVITEGLRVQVPPIGTRLDETGWKETPSSTRIGELVADGSSVEIARRYGNPLLIFKVHTLRLNSVSRYKPFSYAVFITNALPTGEIRAHGKFGPWNSDDAGQTTASGEFTFERADLGNFDGIAGMLGAVGKFQGTLGHLETNGTITIPDFMVTRSKHPVAVSSNYQAFVDGTDGDVTLERVSAALQQTRVVANGKIAGAAGQDGKTATMDLSVTNGRIQDVLRLFVRAPKSPMNGITSFRAHVVIPPGDASFLRRVRLSGDFGIGGGEFAKSTTQADVDTLSERAREIKVDTKAADDDADRVMTNLAGHVELRGAVANFTDFSFEVPGASARMQGTYNLENKKIDLHGTLKTEAELSQMTTGFKSALLKPFNGFFKKKHHGAVVPVHMLGTYEAPQVGLDLPGTGSGAPPAGKS